MFPECKQNSHQISIDKRKHEFTLSASRPMRNMPRLKSCQIAKTNTRLARYVRLWIIGISVTGTRAYLFRAIRYTVHQFLKSVVLFLSALLYVPKSLKSVFIYSKNRLSKIVNKEHWVGSGIKWKSPGSWAISLTVKDAFAGIPSLVRGVIAGIQAQFYGFTHSVYHIIEAVKGWFAAKGRVAQTLGETVSHAFSVVKANLFATFSAMAISVSHFFEYFAGLWETFRTGTSQTTKRLKEKEQTWATHVFSRFDNGKDYISNKVTLLFNAISGVVNRIENTFSYAQASVVRLIENMRGSSQHAIENVKTKVSLVKETVHSAEHRAAERLKIRIEGIINGAEALIEDIRRKTIETIMKIPEARNTFHAHLRTYYTRSKELIHSGRTAVRARTATGKNFIIVHLTAAGRSTGHFMKRLARPFISPVVSLVHFPKKTVVAVSTTSVWTYVYLIAVLAGLGYFGCVVKRRQKNEMYARKLKLHKKVRDGCQELNLSDNVLRQCMEKLRAQIELGLNPATREKSTVKCFNTYVQDLPTGKEKGQFLALDLGGTNFRVLLITLNGRHFDMQSKIYVVPKDIMIGPGEDLFNHIASCLESFAMEHRVANKNLPLGFTFSFPLNQVGLKSGILTRWTKGFNCAGTVGSDVVEMLNKALEKHKDSLKIDVVAVLNDTTGTLMSCAWKNHNCKVGVILGTGSNACYVEKIQNVVGFDGDKSKPHVIINTEWGAFGDKGELDFIRTPYDKEIDKNSVNPGKQLHEKMISGMYLGELARLLIVKFVKDKILFGGHATPLLMEKDKFLTEYISSIESDPRGVFKQCRNVLSKLGISDPTDQDCSNVRYICESVSRRAAHLASAGVATLLNKMEIPSVTVGVDGSLYRYHPHFHNLMYEKIPELLDSKIENPCINLMLSEDGSGRGAALIAASGSEHQD